MFPNLAERADNAAGVLSGGESQMLTICRTLMGDPELIMIDEPTEGLAPRLVEQVAGLFEEVKRRGVSILDEEEIAGEEVVPRQLVDDSNRQPVLRIGAAIEILHEQRLALGMLQEVVVEWLELLRCDRRIAARRRRNRR